jgi:hypothetical protein
MSWFKTDLEKMQHKASQLPFNPTTDIPKTNVQEAIEQAIANAALSSNDFLVKTATDNLTAERVVTDTTTVAWDWATAGQAKAAVVDDSITFAKMQNIATDRLIGRDTASTGDPETITVGGGLEFTGSGGIQRSALTGDVTASAGSNAMTLDAAAVLAKLLTVDGAGSGLDADLLDGQSSAYYATATSVSDHLADTADAHDASAISVSPSGSLAADDVQEALLEILGDIEAHVADNADAHDASAISIVDAGGYITGTDVEAAIQEMAADIAALDQAVVLKGTWDASSGSFPGGGAAQSGWSYIVSVGGTVDSVAFVANDRILAITDNASTSTYASNWHKLDYTDQVLSVDGMTGAVSLASTYQPLDGDLTSWAGVTRASGFDTFVATPSSANLRALLTDETGTGVAYFAGGDAGTPSAIVLTNATGLPTAGLVDDAVTYAKMQNISATDRLLGRDTAGAGNTEEISLNATLEFTGSQAIQRAALTGAITASAGSNATTATGAVNIVIDGGGSAITTGVKTDIRFPFAVTLTAWTLMADASGAIKIDLWKDTYANFPPDNSDSITNASEPEITASGTKAEDTDISNWTDVTVDAGDIIRVNVDSAATVTRAVLTLHYTKTG